MKRRGALALFLFFLLLFPVPRSDGQVVSGAILLTRAVIWGSKVIRASIPFSVTRLKNVYNLWKSRGRPAFSKLKIPIGSAILYIGASRLLSEFERIYQNERG